MSGQPSFDDAERVLFDLVSTASVSGDERGASEVFARHATRLGLDAHVDDVGSAIAHRGAGDAGTHIVLLGHIDTVPGEIPVRVEDGVLHGRGSVDAKGPLAAMLIAASRVGLRDGVRITVVGAAGEETPTSPGARRIAPMFRPSACIIGEPSGWDGVTLGYKGRLLARAIARRENHHSAGAEGSACDEVLAWWARVLAHVARVNEGREGAFASLRAGVRSMASTCDGLVQEAEIDAGFRLGISDEPEDLACLVRELAGEGIDVTFDGLERACMSDRNDPVVRALSGAIRAAGGRPRPKLKTGTSDMNVVGPIWGCPIAAYGPGDSTLDHTPEERLSLAEFRRSIEVLTRALAGLIDELCASATVRSPRRGVSG